MKLNNLACKIHSCGEQLRNSQVDFLADEINLGPEIAYYFKKRRGDQPCFVLRSHGDRTQYTLDTSYYIGIDWIKVNKYAIYVTPKINTHKKYNRETDSAGEVSETDYLKMLFDCIRHEEVASEIDELFEIKWDQPEIVIPQEHDLLTPILVIQFLLLVKGIVRKGLKKSYYRIEKNLHSKIKGKIVISETIKHNLLKNKKLNTVCSYEEFGDNGLENRLIKKALLFVQRYLPTYQNFESNAYLNDLFNFINPAFSNVSDDIQLYEIHHTKVNVFYKEYTQAIRLSKLILSRYGYNIRNIDRQEISTPPFWIDMSKLFELYALGLLKDQFHNQVKYHFTHYGNELDFILKADNCKMVIDAKYKSIYCKGHNDEDIRQVCGYARLKKVYEFLGIIFPESIDCLIVYPDQESGLNTLDNVDLRETKISMYHGVFKIGIKLPLIKGKSH